MLAVLLIGLVTAAQWVVVHRLQKQTSKPTEVPEVLAFCAWCTWRDQETCTHPGGPVGGQGCGPVCSGRERCEVREVERWGRRSGA